MMKAVVQSGDKAESALPNARRDPAKARLGPAGDAAEREADSVVAGRPVGAVGGSLPGAAQRKCAECEEEDKQVRRKEASSTAVAQDSGNAVSTAVSSGGAPLTPGQRAYFEPRFGRDLSEVRLHTGGDASNAAASIDALAFTVGNHVAFAAGTFDDASAKGRRLIAHELVHVVQQRGDGGAVVQRVPNPCPEIKEASQMTDMEFYESDCFPEASRKMPPECELTAGQLETTAKAQSVALGRVNRALAEIMLGGDEAEAFAGVLAQQVFVGDPPSLQESKDWLSSVSGLLGGTIPFSGKTCGYSKCQDVRLMAFVDGPGKLPIYLCPRALRDLGELPRTILHEALHWVGLDANRQGPETYCENFDCRTPCQDKSSVDAWAHYLDCLGQRRELHRAIQDKPFNPLRKLPESEKPAEQ